MARGVSQGCLGGGLLLRMAFGSFDYGGCTMLLYQGTVRGYWKKCQPVQSATGVQIGILSMIGRGLWRDK